VDIGPSSSWCLRLSVDCRNGRRAARRKGQRAAGVMAGHHIGGGMGTPVLFVVDEDRTAL
jgi:hypothetical protein